MPIVNSFAGASARSLGLGAAGGLGPFFIEYVVVAGGGGGGGGSYTPGPTGAGFSGGGGGGGGGYKANIPGEPSGRNSPALPALEVSVDTAYTLIVGAGGAGGAAKNAGSPTTGADGSNSTFASVTSNGGGRGGSAADNRGNPGGSSGGVHTPNGGDATSGLTGQGYPGGNNYGVPGPFPYAPPGVAYEIGGTGGGGSYSAGTDSPGSAPTGPGVGGSNGTPGGDGIAPAFYPRSANFPSYGGGAYGCGGGGGAAGWSPTPVSPANSRGLGGRTGGDPTSSVRGGPGGWIMSGTGGNGFTHQGAGGGGGFAGPDFGSPTASYSGGNGGSGSILLKIPILYTATFTPGVTQRSSYGDVSPVSSPTHRYYDIVGAGPTDTVTFGAA